MFFCDCVIISKCYDDSSIFFWKLSFSHNRASSPRCGFASLFFCCGQGQEDAQRGPTGPTWSSTRLQTFIRNWMLGRSCLSFLSVKVGCKNLHSSAQKNCNLNLLFISFQSLQQSPSSWWSWKSLLMFCRTTAYSLEKYPSSSQCCVC